MLPRPEYVPAEEDPAWLRYAAQFHGHLGPWAVAGLRFGMAGRRAVRASGYFDVRVTCEGPFEKPPRSCFLDGIQVATGATLGKRNLTWAAGKRIGVVVENTRDGNTVELRPKTALMELLASIKPPPAGSERSDRAGERDHDALESIARRIARLPESEILQVTPPK